MQPQRRYGDSIDVPPAGSSWRSPYSATPPSSHAFIARRPALSPGSTAGSGTSSSLVKCGKEGLDPLGSVSLRGAPPTSRRGASFQARKNGEKTVNDSPAF